MKPGDSFHHYELRRRLGEGGMGRVFLAWDRTAEREVALKLVALDGDPLVLDNEKRGAVLQANLAAIAPEVAAVYHHAEAEGFFFVAMEYVDGQDLVHELARGPLALDRALPIAEQLASFLDKAHAAKGELEGVAYHAVVHGDIKPENIRLQESEPAGQEQPLRVRLFDFGTAQVLSRDQPKIPLLFGTYPYTAPERLVDDGLADTRADLWAVGVILYQMIAGRPPYQATSEEELKEKILGETPARLPDDCPKPLRKIIQLCLARDPERRYPSAADLLLDLEAFRTGRLVVAERLEPTSAKTQRTTRRPAGPRGDTGIFPGAAGELPPPLPPLPTPPIPPLPPDATATTYYPTALPVYPSNGMVHPPPPDPRQTPSSGAFFPLGAATLTRLRRLKPSQWLLLLLLAFLGLLVASASLSAKLGQGLVQEIHGGLDLDVALKRYRTLRTWNIWGLGLGTTRKELAQALETEVDRIFAGYRQEVGGTKQGDWESADRYLTALQDLSSSSGVEARRAYCDGHLARLRAAEQRAKNRDAARASLADAIYHFERAADIDEKWADPHLGLARIYAYDSPDLSRLQAALNAARERGYRWSRRESAQLADGFKAEGEALWGRSKKFRDEDSVEKEQELLQQSRSHLLQAIEIYDEIIDYARAAGNKKAALAVLRQVDLRLVSLHAVQEAQDDDEGFFF